MQKDKRIQKTLQLLREAFFELVLSYSYDEITVSHIIQKAQVGRSTFYQHYKNKDEMLVASLHFPLSVLVNTVKGNHDKEQLRWLMDHFWSNRRFAPRIFAGTARKLVIAELAKQIENELSKLPTSNVNHSTIPVALFSNQLAEALMTPIIDWLLVKEQCTIDIMTHHIEQTSFALCGLVKPLD